MFVYDHNLPQNEIGGEKFFGVHDHLKIRFLGVLVFRAAHVTVLMEGFEYDVDNCFIMHVCQFKREPSVSKKAQSAAE